MKQLENLNQSVPSFRLSSAEKNFMDRIHSAKDKSQGGDGKNLSLENMRSVLDGEAKTVTIGITPLMMACQGTASINHLFVLMFSQLAI